MLMVERQIMIDLPHAKSWTKLRDITLASNYIPNVEKIEIMTPKKEGVGASRKAYLENGTKIVNEKVVAWKDEEGFTLELDMDGKRVLPLFDKFHFRYYIEEVSHKTFFKAAILYEPRFNFAVRLQQKIYNCAFSKNLDVICASMKAYYETNQATSKARLKEIKKKLKFQLA